MSGVLESCNSCNNIIDDIKRLSEQDHAVSGDRFRVVSTAAAPPAPDGSVVVDVRYDIDAYVETDKSGKEFLNNAPKSDQDLQIRLVRSASGWLVLGLRSVTL